MKKLIGKFIEKRLERGWRNRVFGGKTSYAKHLFVRWIIEVVSDKKKQKDVLSSISSYLYNKDAKLPFTDVFLVGNTVCVFTKRPGLWIGKGGQTQEEIINKLNNNVDGKKIADYDLFILCDMSSPNYEISQNVKILSYLYGSNKMNFKANGYGY